LLSILFEIEVKCKIRDNQPYHNRQLATNTTIKLSFLTGIEGRVIPNYNGKLVRIWLVATTSCRYSKNCMLWTGSCPL